MKVKLQAMVLAIALLGMQGCVYYQSGYASDFGYYGGTGVYEYYNLPTGYHYEHWGTRGPVIIETLTGAVVTMALLRSMYPHHHWHHMYNEPHFVRDYRRHGHVHPVPPPRVMHHRDSHIGHHRQNHGNHHAPIPQRMYRDDPRHNMHHHHGNHHNGPSWNGQHRPPQRPQHHFSGSHGPYEHHGHNGPHHGNHGRPHQPHD